MAAEVGAVVSTAAMLAKVEPEYRSAARTDFLTTTPR